MPITCPSLPFRRLRPAVAVAAAAAALAAVPTASASPPCAPEGSVTVLADAYARVWRTPVAGGFRYVGCDLRTGRSTVLGGDDARQRLRSFVLVKNIVAWRTDVRGEDDTVSSVPVGTQLRTAHSTAGEVTKVLLAEFGELAWLVRTHRGESLYADVGRRQAVTLDTAVAPDRLTRIRVDGHVLRWRHGHFDRQRDLV